MGGTEKTVPVDKPEDVTVAVGKCDGGNRRRALEPGKTRGLHPGRIPEVEKIAERSEFAVGNKKLRNRLA